MTAQLDPAALPSDALAHRLARDVLAACCHEEFPPLFEFVTFDYSGAITPALVAELERVAAHGTPRRARDPQGYAADLRALRAYVEAKGDRGPLPCWDLALDRDTVVPWCYGRAGR